MTELLHADDLWQETCQLYSSHAAPALPEPLACDQSDLKRRGPEPGKILPGIDLLSCNNVEVCGLGILTRQGNILSDPAIFPEYFPQIVKRYLDASDEARRESGARPWFGAMFNSAARRIHVDEAIFCLHPNMVYGHFLLEILPRILIADEVMPRDIPLLFPAGFWPWLLPIVRTVIGDRPIALYDHNADIVDVRRLWSISHAFTGMGMHNAASEGFARLVRQNRVASLRRNGRHPETAKRLVFLSRSEVSTGWHKIRDEVAIENILAGLGFEIVHPQKLPFSEQIALMQDCRIIVSEYGSALHNAVFAPAGTRIISLNRINWYQDCIAAAKEHRIGYLKPDDGNFVWKREMGSTQVSLSAERVRQAVVATISEM